MAARKGPVRVLHCGLGPIGAAVVRQVAARRGFKIVGAVDIDPAKAGRDLGEVAAIGRALKVKVSSDAKKTIKATKPDVVVLCTLSSLKKVLPQMEEILKLRVPIVSTTEELAYPTKSNMRYARAIHQLAKKHKVAVLGTGVNPGFAMDYLPVVLSGAAKRVDAVRVHRVQDAGLRREPLQAKVGAGITREEFDRRVATGSMGHVGLTESAQAVAAALGWDATGTSETIEPVVADEPTPSAFGTIEPGQIAGIDQVAVVVAEGVERVRLHLQMAVGIGPSQGDIWLTGDPDLHLSVPGGLHGDLATAAALVNTVGSVRHADPGLRVMSELRPPRPSAS